MLDADNSVDISSNTLTCFQTVGGTAYPCSMLSLLVNILGYVWGGSTAQFTRSDQILADVYGGGYLSERGSRSGVDVWRLLALRNMDKWKLMLVMTDLVTYVLWQCP